MFLCHNDDEERGPVAQDGQKVAEDDAKMFPPRNAGDSVNDEDEDDPEEAGYHRKRATECLDRKCGGVRVGDIVGTVFFVSNMRENKVGSRRKGHTLH